MPVDIYLKTTNYPAQPYAGPGILCVPQLVPWACLPTLTSYSVTVPLAGKGKVRREAEKRGLLALPLPLGHGPCPPLAASQGPII